MENEGRVLLIAAHPDDEVIGAAIRMTHWDPRQLTIVHITNGSPRGLPDREAYARARREELNAALSLAGIGRENCRELGFTDQEAYLHLPELIEKIADLIEELRPDVVYTHPYEGGHPDHDAAAFACALAGGRPETWPTKFREFTSYHASPNGLVTGEFLGEPGTCHSLTSAERRLKQKMFDCFRTQEPVLRNFQIVHERLRPAPSYDFTAPPHPGQLHYETLGWNITGEDWRSRAKEALVWI